MGTQFPVAFPWRHRGGTCLFSNTILLVSCMPDLHYTSAIAMYQFPAQHVQHLLSPTARFIPVLDDSKGISARTLAVIYNLMLFHAVHRVAAGSVPYRGHLVPARRQVLSG